MIMNIFKKILCLVIGLTGIILTGCNKSETEVNTKTFSITTNSDEALFSYTAPEKAEAGETVTINIKVVKENHHIAFVTANSVACEKVSGDETEASYSFIMPEKDVEISIIVVENEPDHYRIFYPTDEAYTQICKITGPEWGAVEADVEVTFKMTEKYESFMPVEVMANDIPCELTSSRISANEYVFKFTMPAEDVTITFKHDHEMHLITVEEAENSYVTMLNSGRDWDADPVIFEAWYGYYVKFLYGGELGFTADLKAVTASGIELDVTWLESDETAPNGCWMVQMPDEPISLSTVAHEKTDYLGKPFVGVYKGYQVIVGENNMFKSSTPTFSLDMRGNTAFFAKSTDSNKFDFDGCYQFDENSDTFAYRREYSDNGYGEVDYGVSGKYFSNGDAFIYISNLQVPKPDYVKYYFASKDDFDYFCAATDQYGVRYLAEIDKKGMKSWYYIETQSMNATKVNLTFTSGSTIAEACSAIAYYNGTALFRYDHAAAGSKPVFTMRGSEAGTYKAADGSGADLVLDGFGNVSGASNGTYTVDKNIVNASDGTSYIIDTSEKTYTKVVTAEWSGSLTFIGEQAGAGVWNGNKGVGKFELYLNRTYEGTAKGKARIIMTANGEDLYKDDVAYAWNPAKKQIILSGVYVGSGHSSGSRQDLILDVSDDLNSMTVENIEYFHSGSSNNDRYLVLKDIVLKAQQ